MTEFFPEIEVREHEAAAIARGLWAIAHADGEIHPKELALIAELYAAEASHPSMLAELERASMITPEILAAQLGSPEVRKLFVKTALLMAYADGACSDKETEMIGGFARELEVSDSELGLLEVEVKEYLLSQLTHLHNVAAAAKVANELEL